MKTSIKFLSVLFISATLATSCNDNDDDAPAAVAHTVEITADPTTEISDDATVTITAVITDTDAPTPAPTYTYTWYKSDSATEDGTVIADATSSTYTTPTATVLTAGSHYYYVAVEDGTAATFNPVKSNIIEVVVSAAAN
ncbi:hypothetical protein [Flavicella sediminum]|uniref:hypothetical protein n=1 Tax=Flavicella sediminum TaxID=2585141 RepID=UPI0011219006|nr:hypothetical protein [Flavicella sediminum]